MNFGEFRKNGLIRIAKKRMSLYNLVDVYFSIFIISVSVVASAVTAQFFDWRKQFDLDLRCWYDGCRTI